MTTDRPNVLFPSALLPLGGVSSIAQGFPGAAELLLLGEPLSSLGSVGLRQHQLA